jgi:hypothetical protein
VILEWLQATNFSNYSTTGVLVQETPASAFSSTNFGLCLHHQQTPLYRQLGPKQLLEIEIDVCAGIFKSEGLEFYLKTEGQEYKVRENSCWFSFSLFISTYSDHLDYSRTMHIANTEYSELELTRITHPEISNSSISPSFSVRPSPSVSFQHVKEFRTDRVPQNQFDWNTNVTSCGRPLTDLGLPIICALANN